MNSKFILSLDVGLSTGVVFARCEQKSTPVLLSSGTIRYSTKPPLDVFEMLFQIIDSNPLDVILVEYPISAPFSKGASLTLESARPWRRWVESQKEQDRTVLEVTPSRWKSTPSRSVQIHDLQDDPMWKTYRPTRHETDAAAIIHWYSFFGSLSQ